MHNKLKLVPHDSWRSVHTADLLGGRMSPASLWLQEGEHLLCESGIQVNPRRRCYTAAY